MNKVSQNTTIDHLIDTYYQKGSDCIYSFIQKRYTRFTEANHKRIYDWNQIKDNKQSDNKLKTEEEFISYCKKEQIDSFYYESMIQQLSGVKDHQRYKEIQEKKSNFHSINKIISARKNCIKMIKQTLSEVMKQSIIKFSQLDKLCMQLIHIRMMTLVLVQTIFNWKSSLKALVYQMIEQSQIQGEIKFRSVESSRQIKSDKCQIDPITQICEDTDFFKVTILKKYLKFTKGLDPLLMRITRNKKQEGTIVKIDDGDRFSDFFKPDFNILSRLRQAEGVLIKHYSKIFKQQSPERGVRSHRLTQIRINCFDSIKESESKNISVGQIIDNKIEAINLRQKKQRKYSQNPQNKQSMYLKKVSVKTNGPLHTTRPRKQTDPRLNDLFTLKKQRQLSMVDKIKQIKKQFKSHSLKKQTKTFQKQKISTQPNQQNQSRIAAKQIFKLLPKLLDKKIQPISQNKRKLSDRAQKIKFLNRNYRTNIKTSLNTQFKLPKTRESQSVQKRNSKQVLDKVKEIPIAISIKQKMMPYFASL